MLGSPLTHIRLIVIIRLSMSAILVRLHHGVVSSGTRCSSCKSVVLVTLEGCHLLDGLVVVSVEARKEDCAVLRRSDCEEDCAHHAGSAKSNTSRACH